MKQYTFAIVLTASFAAVANAQPPTLTPGPTPPPGSALLPGQWTKDIVIGVTGSKPPSGYYKTGGELVGADGYYPFDTGWYLLGGYEGLARKSGTFYVIPSATAYAAEPAAPVYGPVVYPAYKHGLFHRR
jgi:hypothetical protein